MWKIESNKNELKKKEEKEKEKKKDPLFLIDNKATPKFQQYSPEKY